jgi:PPOX class probable F420-dependent enzyme
MPKQFSTAEREQFLAGRHIAVLSVSASDGRPPASVPIWYGTTADGNLLISTGRGRRKARLIDEAGVVTLVFQREEPPYQYVIAEGTVVDTATPAPLPERVAIAARYLGDEAGRAFAEQMDGAGSVLYTIRPDRWSTADFSGEL